MDGVEQLAGTRREYRVKGYTALPVVLAAVIAVLVPWIYFADGMVPAALVGLLSVVGGFALCLGLQRSRLVLSGSRLEVRGMGVNRSVDRSDIEGIRTFSGEHDTYRALCLKDGRAPIRFSQYATDDTFRQWLERVPDLDQQDRERALAQISADEDLGATPEDRLAALARAKQLNAGLWILAAAAGAGLLWGGAAWRAVSFWTAAATPVAAAVLLFRYPLLYGLFRRRKDPRAELVGALMIPGLALCAFAGQVNFAAHTGLLDYAAVIGLLWVAAFFPGAMRSTQVVSAILWVVLTGLFYCWGVTAGADVAADQAGAETWTTVVVGKYTVVSGGRGRSTTYRLRLAPWGPYASAAASIRVPESVYEATHVHDLACIRLHAGWLHAPWYEAVPCPQGNP